LANSPQRDYLSRAPHCGSARPAAPGLPSCWPRNAGPGPDRAGPAYDEFRSVNADFKALVTDWQLNGDQPNTHQDAEYDAAVLARLDAVHQRVVAIITPAATQLPRLSVYSAKLNAALDKVKTGEIAWLTRPLIDSYHTVWFELHEELILAVGLTREEAAKSGVHSNSHYRAASSSCR